MSASLKKNRVKKKSKEKEIVVFEKSEELNFYANETNSFFAIESLYVQNFEDPSKDEDGKLAYKSIKTINFFPSNSYSRIEDKGRNMEKELGAILEDLLFHSGSMFNPSCHDFKVMNNASTEFIVVGFGLDEFLDRVVSKEKIRPFWNVGNFMFAFSHLILCNTSGEKGCFYAKESDFIEAIEKGELVSLFYCKEALGGLYPLKEMEHQIEWAFGATLRYATYDKELYALSFKEQQKLNHALSLGEKKTTEFVKYIIFKDHDAIDDYSGKQFGCEKEARLESLGTIAKVGPASTVVSRLLPAKHLEDHNLPRMVFHWSVEATKSSIEVLYEGGDLGKVLNQIYMQLKIHIKHSGRFLTRRG
ncbi:hypothetical protein M9H77_22352 [Catharanthus roseus]|uniref:Uncharacterized protein n=1 Tax=Catharanthus roseus TaxID=4058 RepID=A0ACC0ASA7_CATRO|nr:hypothetical protein M9H77_22352 [Catharanthus roseus]